MNHNKKNNGWILCPSKSFPGKFYYFNVVNGETAWSLNEAEKELVRNSQFQNIDKGHCYPEPTSPPADNLPLTITKSTSYTPPTIPRHETDNFPSQITNVSSYKPIQQPHPTIPFQIQVPIIVGSDFQNCNPNVLMILMYQSNPRTQLAVEAPTTPVRAPAPVEMFQMVPDRDLFVHSGKQPIGQRIINYVEPVLNFTKENKISKLVYPPYRMSTPNKSNVSAFSHDESSIDTCGLSKMVANDVKMFVNEGQSRRFIGEHSQTPKVSQKESPTVLRNAFAKCPCPYPNVLPKSPCHPNVMPKSPCHPNVLPKNPYHPNLLPKSPSANQNPFISTSPPHLNPYTPNSTNMFIHKSPRPKMSHILRAKQELFPASPVEKQMNTDNFETENNLATNPFKNLKKVTLSPSNRVDIPKAPVKTETILEKTTVTKSNEKATLTQRKKVDSFSSNEDVDHEKILAEHDLRRILIAKKRQYIDLGEPKFIEGKKTRMYVQETPVTPNKKVTFNLVPETISDYQSLEDVSYYYDNVGYSEVDTAMHDPDHSTSSSTRKPWYVVVDTSALIEEFDFLDTFVKMDPKCHLIVPSRVMSDTVALSRGECRARRRVTRARRAVRRLHTPQQHITVQSTPIEDNTADISTEDSILNCCLDGVELNAHVILVTNDGNLKSKAEDLEIPCFSTQQLKDNAVKKPEVQFDFKKIKISIPNAPETTNFELEVPTHVYKNNVLNTTDAKDKCSEDLLFSSDVNAGKSAWKFTSEKINSDLQVLKEFPRLFQIQKDVLNNSTQVLELHTTPKKSDKTIPNLNEKRSLYFQNDEERQLKKETHTVSHYFQNTDKKPQTVSSIFKLASVKFNTKESQTKPSFEMENDQRNPELKKSLFEIEGIENIKTSQVQMKPSIFEENFKPICNNEKYKNIQIKLNNTVSENSQMTNKEIPIKSSIFDWEKCKSKDNQSTSSIFDTEKYENIEVELNNSMFENDQLQTKQTPKRSSVFEIENYKNREVQSRPPIFYNERYKNLEVQLNNSFCETGQYTTEEIQTKSVFNTNNHKIQLQPSIFYNENQKNNRVQLKPSIFEMDETVKPVLLDEIKDKCDLEGQIKKIFVKNSIEENRIEERREEFVCSFKQIMEDCLSNVLQHSSFMHNSMPPPWSLHEALQCIVRLYGSHTTIRTIVNFMNGVLNAKGEVLASGVTAGLGCGLVLIDYLKKLTSNTEALTDAETALLRIIDNGTAPIEEPVKAPGFNHSDLASEENTNRRNFVKKRSEVINYLKKHFPEWTNYDETVNNAEPKLNQRQTYRNTQIVRTIGKNLSLLELNKSKTMTLNKPVTTTAIEYNSPKKQENTKSQNMKENNGNMDNAGQIINNQIVNPDKSPKKVIQKFRHLLKLAKNVDDKPRTDGNIDNTDKNIDARNINTDVKETVPKIIRLFDNIHLTKEQIEMRNAKECQKPILDLDYSTYGHGFGTNEEAGPKMIRNVTVIDAIEDTLKKKNVRLDLDQLDYSVMSDDEHAIEDNLKNDIVQLDVDELDYSVMSDNDDLIKNDTDDCLSTNMKNNNSKLNDEENDHLYPTNDNLPCDMKHFDNTSLRTNNCSHSMSFDNCVNDKPNDSAINDKVSTNDGLQAYSFVKTFLFEVSSSFKLVHKFIEDSIKEFRDVDLLESKKAMLHSKASAVHAEIIQIVDKLKRIIQRESANGTTLKTLLASAGLEASGDKRVTRYRQVVMKCQEQGQMLEKALRLMLSVTDVNLDSASCITNSNTNVRYFNIFE